MVKGVKQNILKISKHIDKENHKVNITKRILIGGDYLDKA